MYKKCYRVLFLPLLLCVTELAHADYPPSIFVPRQLSYNPILENAAVLAKNRDADCWNWIFSVKPLYTQSAGDKFDTYFNICHKECMNVQENGSGDIDSLWFKVMGSYIFFPREDTFYSSTLSFNPIRKTYGAMLYFALELPRDFEVSINTAAIKATNNMHICETNITNPGIISGFSTLTQSFTSTGLCYGRICGSQSTSGIDDVQIKLIKHLQCSDATKNVDVYGLIGVPTGKGSQAHYLFEPLVGSKHVQLGVGTDFAYDFAHFDCATFSLLGEFKWRYGLTGKETRSFDLCNNGQWSRYLLAVNESNKLLTFPAINVLTFTANVTPRNAVDIYLALHMDTTKWNFELGYDFWYRSAEKISLACCDGFATTVGIADLPGIAILDPQSASTANISQGVNEGIEVLRAPPLTSTNSIVSDPAFIPITISDINKNSGAQPKSMSNSIYTNVSYARTFKGLDTQLGLSFAYEIGANGNTPNNIFGWLNFDLYV